MLINYNRRIFIKHILYVITGCLFLSFKPKQDFEIKKFEPFSNFQYTNDTLKLGSDLSDAVLNGIKIPSVKQCTEGYFKFTFLVKNNGAKPQSYSYKIYYQNDTYKFEEFEIKNKKKVYNQLASENFYGSWDDMGSTFHKTAIIPNDGEFHLVTDSLRINGNPRNEKKYFRKSNLNQVTQEKIDGVTGYIRSNPDALNDVKQKALKENRTIDEQLHLDAVWIIQHSDNDEVPVTKEKINIAIASMRSRPDAMKDIKQKSLREHRSVDEQLYLDALWTLKYPKNDSVQITQEKIDGVIGYLKSTPDAIADVKQKALKENRTIDEQLRLDALWIIKQDKNEIVINDRWKRNPRMGNYSFMLVAGAEEDMNKIPAYISDISGTINNTFINPYFYYRYDENSAEAKKNIAIIQSDKILKTSAKFDLGTGIDVDVLKYQSSNTNESYFNNNCNSSKSLYHKAQFEQFFHRINRNFTLKNIPVIADVTNNEFTQADYDKNLELYKSKSLITDYVKTTECPCKTVKSDSVTKSLAIYNPGNEPGVYKKEHVGVNSRIGFTYGKYIAKVKFPKIVNNTNVWNGLTCAFWLIYQGEGDWNNRRIDNTGYIPKADDNKATSKRVSTTNYSEIDFEILKTSEFWPVTSYADKSKYKKDNAKANKNIIVTCTNWDLASKSPKNNITGAKDFKFNNQNFVLHRWDEWYKALTTKYEVNHDSIFGQSYYYEIDWFPSRIVWLIGKSKDKMKVVAAMDNTVTSVPNNQMLIVFTQEFHDASWWPLSPFNQNYVPFPKSDITGEIEDVEIQ